MSKNNKAYDRICNIIRPSLDHNAHMLELACGTGQFTQRLATATAKWTATDFSSGMVRRAKERNLPGVTAYEVADATNLQYEDESFDCVLIANALHIMPKPDAALREIHRVLVPGGVLYAPTFVYEGKIHGSGLSMVKAAGFRTYSYWTCDSFAEFVESHGFEIASKQLLQGNPAGECLLVAVKR